MASSDSFSITSNVTVCCFGANHIGVSVSTVIAHNCQNIHVSITDLNPNRIRLWNEKELKIHEPNLEKMLNKCLSDNLMFTSDMRSAIVLADIVLIAVDIPVIQSKGQTVLNMSEFEEAARIIAKMSESSKIIVQKCTSTLKSLKFLKTILNANKSKNVNFQVLTMPEFFSSGSAISCLSNPELVLIGRDVCPDDDEAAATLAAIYSHWVPWERIKILTNSAVELIRIGINTLLAQKLTSVGAFAAICEQSGQNVSEITRILNECKGKNDAFFEPGFKIGEVNLNRDVLNLINMCQKKNISISASHWQEVVKLNEYQEIRFKNKILSAFSNALRNKKFAVFGLLFKGNGEITSESPAITLSGKLLDDGATLSLYDPNIAMDREKVFRAVKDCGKENAMDRVTFFEDPYKAAVKVHGIIFCSDLNSFKSLDYTIIYRDMIKPAYIFDGQNTLDHDYLVKMGFNVKTIGRNY